MAASHVCMVDRADPRGTDTNSEHIMNEWKEYLCRAVNGQGQLAIHVDERENRIILDTGEQNKLKLGHKAWKYADFELNLPDYDGKLTHIRCFYREVILNEMILHEKRYDLITTYGPLTILHRAFWPTLDSHQQPYEHADEFVARVPKTRFHVQ